MTRGDHDRSSPLSCRFLETNPCVMTILARVVRRWLVHLLLLLALAVATTSTCVVARSADPEEDEDDNEIGAASASCSASSLPSSSPSSYIMEGEEEPVMRMLTPADLPDPVWFTNFSKTIQYELPGGFQRTVEEGMVYPVQFADKNNNQLEQSNRTAATTTTTPASIAVVQAALDRPIVQQIRSLLEEQQLDCWDAEPDTVDAMPTYEIYMDSPAIRKEQQKTKEKNGPTTDGPSSSSFLRQQFHALTRSHVDILTSLVQQHYPDACQSSSSNHRHHHPSCQPCFSLVRRYRQGERQSHATHQDGHALVTVVVSLSDHGSDYRGGLYVSTGHGERQFVALNAGDAALHQPFLYHGVQVLDVVHDPAAVQEKEQQRQQHLTKRWSWILWYKDGCDKDREHEWFAMCAAQGDAVCQYLYSTKDVPGASSTAENQRILHLTRAAAHGGVGEAAVKMARGYLQLLPSPLPYNETLAQVYYVKGIQVGNPDAHYGMAQLILQKLERHTSIQGTKEGSTKGEKQRLQQEQYLRKVIRHLEEAAWLGHSFAAFNLGIVHAFGYGGVEMNTTLSHEWLIESDLPEGLYIASKQTKAAPPDVLVSLEQRARKLGWGQAWRKQAREQTGSGGAGGVDLNLPWPVSPLGSRPPRV
eukprot:scaffold5478_cov161-Amphora_coffeaeformis.AAC.4